MIRIVIEEVPKGGTGLPVILLSIQVQGESVPIIPRSTSQIEPQTDSRESHQEQGAATHQ